MLITINISLDIGKLVSVPSAEEKRQTSSQQSDDAAESHIFFLVPSKKEKTVKWKAGKVI